MKVYISTAERSGGVYAGLISERLRSSNPSVEIVRSCEDALAPVGFAEGAKASFDVIARMRSIEHEVRLARPDVFLAVAWSEPNMLLGLRLKDMKGLRRVFFAPPQLWAWGSWRKVLLRRGYDALLCLYPKEMAFLRSLGLPAYFRGNPLADFLRPYLEKKRPQCGPGRTVALLAGSRLTEKRRHETLLVEFMRKWRKRHPKDRAVWLFLTPEEALKASKLLEEGEAYGGDMRYPALAQAQLAVVASGTASLEAALLGTPQVAFYRLPKVELFLARALTHVKRFALPNLVFAREVVTELLNPTVQELLGAAENAICQEDEGSELAQRLHKELAPIDNLQSLLSIL